MFQKIIKNIRSKPESVRKGITLGVSLGFTTIVAFFWFISFLNYSSQVLTAKPKIESPSSFLSKISTIIGESYANVRTKMSAGSGFVKGNVNIQNGGASTTSASSNSSSTLSSGDVTDDIVAPTTEHETTGENFVPTTTSTETNSNVNTNTSSSNSSKSLNDILNTKSRVNQENKATTSSEVLVQ